MEELEKGLKELKEFATHRKNNNINQPNPQADRDWTTNQRVHMKGPVASAAYIAEDGLVGNQWEERPLVLGRIHTPV